MLGVGFGYFLTSVRVRVYRLCVVVSVASSNLTMSWEWGGIVIVGCGVDIAGEVEWQCLVG